MLVYKYRGGNDEKTFERDLSSIINNYFWGSSFDELNDPCENVVVSDKFLKQTKAISSFFSKKRNDAFVNLHTAFNNLLAFNKRIGIYALSKTYLDELLWAHYANSHKGFCIEYDSDLLISSFKTEKVFSYSVLYGNNPPEITIKDITIKNDGLIYKMTAYKSKRWEYEKEYRIVTDNFGKQSYNYEAVKSIYFGLRMDKDQKLRMMKQLSDREIKFYQIEHLEKSYKFKATYIKNPFSSELKYMTAIPASVTGRDAVKFKILEKYFIRLTSKGNITLELESIISEEEIKWIATKIKNELFHTAERLYIFYNLQDIAWATSHFEKDGLKITINDFALNLK
ncbi:DUF2971 domain-containing protein [Flavobacterium sp. ACN6]|uniref:DUF2971 domain-containing protein n=1 Tax=Flavobacterium sp. ACN6 TaxID=1920426 RepID=UPI00114508D8|nr:DUF2971 domain-containing protein [Flavobacterium sp. ACN6]PBJ11517.1 hypothetical protein BSF42_29240 [Flavobacterium sp. ACN6]